MFINLQHRTLFESGPVIHELLLYAYVRREPLRGMARNAALIQNEVYCMQGKLDFMRVTNEA